MNVQRRRLAATATAHLRTRQSAQASLRTLTPVRLTSSHHLAPTPLHSAPRTSSFSPIARRAFITMMPMDEDAQMPTINLTPLEDAIVTLLADTCAWIRQTQPQPPQDLAPAIEYTEGWEVTARIAGGWVRDRLLSQASHDLDISLSSLTGHTFALLLSAYLKSSQFAASPLASHPAFVEHGLEAKSMGSLAKIVANPEQGKTLETATANVMGLDLDFVNLRKEVYQGTSRIPVMSFGTPHEDAERRDTTINSLFFNVHTRRVEDWTGQGLRDLQDGLIRTPLPALRTFLDDPLRVLRCVRFAARFGYRLDEGITQCLGGEQGESVRSALAGKVSRERFGIEVDKMLGGPDPHRALHLLEALQLFHTTFLSPLQAPLRQLEAGTTNALTPQLGPEAEPASARVALRGSRILDALWRSDSCGGPSRTHQAGEEAGIPPLPPSALPDGLVDALPSELLAPLRDQTQRRRLFLAAALLPLRRLGVREKGEKWCWSGELIIANGLKLGKANTRDPAAALTRAMDVLEAPSLESLGTSHAQYKGKWITALAPEGASPKATLGLLLQHPSITYSPHALSFAPALLISLVAELVRRWEENDSSAAASSNAASDVQALPASAVEVAKTYAAFWRQANEWQLVQRAEEKPILDGKQIAETLAFQPGQLTKRIQTSILAWQLDRACVASAGAEQSEREACQAWLKAAWEKGGIVPLEEREVKAVKVKKGKQQQQNGEQRPVKRQKSEE